MNEPQDLYPILLEASKKAFTGRLFAAAYHGLSAALCCAVELKDLERLREVEHLAQEQYEFLRSQHYDSAPQKEPVELSLYTSLLQIVRTRTILLSHQGTPRK